MKMSRLVAALGVALAGTTLVAPQSAYAATASAPGALKGIAAVRGTQAPNNAALQGEKTYVQWRSQADATRYRVSVVEGTKTTESVVPADVAAGQMMGLTIATPDKCASYRITVTPENANGAGKPQSSWIGSLMPSMVVKAKAVRGTDPATATFSYDWPQWRGMSGSPKIGIRWPDHIMPVSVAMTPTLIRMADNRVVTSTPTATYTANGRSLKYTGLDPKSAYVLKVSTANDRWGGCTRSDGKILLKAGK